MISVQDECFLLHTKGTTYAFYVNETGNLVHLYYGSKLVVDSNSIKGMIPCAMNSIGTGIVLDEKHPHIFLDDVCLEVSTVGKGDMKDPLVVLEYEDGSNSSDFRYVSHRIEEGNVNPECLPNALGGNQSLIVTLQDRNSEVMMEVIYTLYEDTDCITRYNRLINGNSETIKVKRLMSLQLDSYESEWKVSTFHGEWAREMGRTEVLIQQGKLVSESMTGNSSNKANPFVMFSERNANEYNGDVYATNLIYSGEHREVFEACGHSKMHMLTGINPDSFEWVLEKGACIDSPVAVMTYSNEGYEGISKHMHAFVRKHIVRGNWKDKDRPVLLNSWEANYFNISEKGLLNLAKVAKDTGVELFVMDDGWFGKRNQDTCSLGDWKENKSKLPNGLEGLGQKIHDMGLMFGIWVEPEMVNEDSDLYRKHPEWAVRIPGKHHSLGRNQMVLDLSKTEVQDYLIEILSDVFTRSKVDYVKWDMNRHMSDAYSIQATYAQSEFKHRYILGLYHVLEVLVQRFPDILFEGCASGGNRFDLGMLCYMPQIWASDNTDALCRSMIQNGYSYGYPQSVIGAHVSDCPNHQTLRVTPLKTRFAVAMAGLLGYELNLCDLSKEELNEIKEQIKLYKKFRHTLQFGQLYRLKDTMYTKPLETDLVRWNIVSKDKSEAVGIVVQNLSVANYAHHRFKSRGLDDDKIYHFYNIPYKVDIMKMGSLINMVAPIHIKQDSLVHTTISKLYKLDSEKEDYCVTGNVLNKAGLALSDGFAGTGMDPNTAFYQDFDAKIYLIEEK